MRADEDDTLAGELPVKDAGFVPARKELMKRGAVCAMAAVCVLVRVCLAQTDRFDDVEITPIMHACVQLEWAGKIIHMDPRNQRHYRPQNKPSSSLFEKQLEQIAT